LDKPAAQPGPASPNGSPFPGPSRLPKAQRKSRPWRWVLPAVAVLLMAVVGAIWFVWFRGPAVRADLVTAKVEYRDLQLKVVERGTLEAKENRDIKCEVKTGNRGAPKIKWVVDNGALVKKGDLLVDIDDSYLQDQATTQKIARDNAENDKIKAEQDYPGLQIAIDVAEQNLKKWVQGDFPQQLHDLEGQIQTAESNLLQEEDRMAWVSRMVKKGYMTASQQEAEQALLMGYKLALQKAEEQKTVLTKYTDAVNRLTFDTAIKTAKNAERAGYANMESKRAVFKQQEDQYQDLLEQIKQCKVKAEHAGIVVYAVPEQTQRGAGATQSIIAQGEPVQYGQKMMSIPDLSHMLVNVRIHEAFINHMDVSARVESVQTGGPADKAGIRPGDVIVKVGPKPIKGYPDLVDALRTYKPDGKVKLKILREKDESDVELTMAPKPADEPGNGGGAGPAHTVVYDPNRAFGVHFQDGLPATVRVEAVQGRALKAHVKSVANVASPQDWMSPDVKVYQAYVEIDDNVEQFKLRPGLSAVCTMFTETRAEHALSIPLPAILSPLEKGAKPRVFVMTPRGPEAREIELGMKDETYAEIKSGVNEGEEVILNPRNLLSDKEKKNVKEEEKAPGGPGKQPGGGRPDKGGGGGDWKGKVGPST
jgi:multidrug efflux pump subunit AcrA (membrane-fusion protein)